MFGGSGAKKILRQQLEHEQRLAADQAKAEKAAADAIVAELRSLSKRALKLLKSQGWRELVSVQTILPSSEVTRQLTGKPAPHVPGWYVADIEWTFSDPDRPPGTRRVWLLDNGSLWVAYGLIPGQKFDTNPPWILGFTDRPGKRIVPSDTVKDGLKALITALEQRQPLPAPPGRR